jgi:hypothetical protein
MLKPRMPVSGWQERLFYVVIILIFYQMTIYTATSLSCAYRTIWQNQTITNDKICTASSEDTKDAVAEYLTLVLALISKVPEGNKEKETPTRRKAPPVKSTITPKGTEE